VSPDYFLSLLVALRKVKQARLTLAFASDSMLRAVSITILR